MGAEAQFGQYQTPKGPLKLIIFDYPTPSMAREQAVEFQKIPTPLWKFYLADAAKWLVKRAIRHPDRRRPSYRDWESRTQRARYDCSKARRLPNDRVQVELRVPAESFKTGNVQRDSAMRESIQAAQFPEVELKAVGEVPWPTEFPFETEETFNAQLDFHGQKQELKVPVKLTFQDASHLSAHASFQVSLESFGIERPSLMFVKVDDPLTIEADVAFVPGS